MTASCPEVSFPHPSLPHVQAVFPLVKLRKEEEDIQDKLNQYVHLEGVDSRKCHI